MRLRSGLPLLVLIILSASHGSAGDADAGFDPKRLGRAIIYPVDAVLAGQEGSVLMRVLVASDGSSSKIEWRDGDDTVLATAAFRALIEYRFPRPGRDSERGESWIYVPVRFSFDPVEGATDTAGRPVVGVTPSLRTHRGAPAVTPHSLRPGKRPGESGGDTVLPAVSQGALGKNLYYPDMARFNRFEGTVLVHALVDQRGVVTSAYAILTDNAIFDDAALEAVRKTRFTPGKVAGRARALWTLIPIRFQLGSR